LVCSKTSITYSRSSAKVNWESGGWVAPQPPFPDNTDILASCGSGIIDLPLLVEVDDEDVMTDRGTEKKQWLAFHHDWKPMEGEVIEEQPITIYVNGREFVTLMGTPLNQDWLAVGFLTNEQVIQRPEEIVDLRIMDSGCCVDVWLKNEVSQPSKTIITSGCGGGITYNDPRIGVEPFQDDISVRPEQIQRAFNNLQSKDSLYARSRGVHAAGLLDAEADRLLLVVEDVGRHNTIDKISGAGLLTGQSPRGKVLICTGRISSEMVRKSALMGCAVVASRTSPTSLAVDIAQAWNLTLVGYVRLGKMRVYSAPQRILTERQSELIR
jgi:FdhD protein